MIGYKLVVIFMDSISEEYSNTGKIRVLPSYIISKRHYAHVNVNPVPSYGKKQGILTENVYVRIPTLLLSFDYQNPLPKDLYFYHL